MLDLRREGSGSRQNFYNHHDALFNTHKSIGPKHRMVGGYGSGAPSQWSSRVDTAWPPPPLSVVICGKPCAGPNEQDAGEGIFYPSAGTCSRRTPFHQMPSADVNSPILSLRTSIFTALSSLSVFISPIPISLHSDCSFDSGSTATHYELEQSERLAAGYNLLKDSRAPRLPSPA